MVGLLAGFGLVCTNWIFVQFSFLHIFAILLSLIAMLLREKVEDYQLATLANCIGQAVRPILLVSASFGLLNLPGMGVTVYRKMVMASILWLGMQLGEGIPYLFFSRTIQSANGDTITHLEADSYINLF